MTISLIAAMDKNRVIGKDNALPWQMPADLRRFRELTKGKPVIMGRKTFESIGRPLPQRLNIIITRNPEYRAEGCTIVHSAAEALTAAGAAEEIMVIGGEEIFTQFLPQAGRIYLTIIDAEFAGDAHFLPLDDTEWATVGHQVHPADDANPHPYTFLTLERAGRA